MGNAYLGFADQVESAVVDSVTRQQAQYPASNLFKSHPGDRFEFNTPSTTNTLDIDRGVATDWKLMCLAYTNGLPTSSQWALSEDDNDGYTSTTSIFGTTTMLPGTSDWADAGTNERHVFYLSSTTHSERYLRLAFIDLSMSGNWRMGRLLVSSHNVFANKNITFGSDYAGMVDRSRTGLNAQGRFTTTRGRVARSFRFRVTLTSETDVKDLLNLYEQSGGSREVIFIRDTTETDNRWKQGVVVGYLRQQFRVEHRAYNQFVVQNEIIER